MKLAEAWTDSCSSIGLACRIGDLKTLKHLLKKKRPLDVQDNRGWLPIHEAVFHNHCECVEELLNDDDGDVNCRTFEGETPLFLACLNGNKNIVQALLEHGANPNSSTNDGSSPIFAATKQSSAECVELLHRHGANVNSQDWTGWSPLHEAAKIGSIEIVNSLIKKGAHLEIREDNGITPTFTAAQFGHFEILQSLVGKTEKIECCAADGANPLMMAAQGGHLASVKFLLDKGADPNLKTRDGVMAIHLATQFDHTKCVEVLLDHMSPEAFEPFKMEQCPESVLSILHMAVDWERLDVLKLLLERNLNVDIVSSTTVYNRDDDNLPFALLNNFTPLSLAARNGYVELMCLLMEYGSDLNYSSMESQRPLTSSVLSKNYDAVNLLLSKGCEVNYSTTTCEGPEALYIAIHNNDVSILDLLLKSGANISQCIRDSSYVQMSLNFWTVMTEGNCKSVDDYDVVLRILLKYISYDAYYAILKKLAAVFAKKNTHVVHHCWNILDKPHSLQHKSRIVIRHKLLRTRKNIKHNIKQLDIPQAVVRYLAYENETLI